jgi:hypothetical protein
MSNNFNPDTTRGEIEVLKRRLYLGLSLFEMDKRITPTELKILRDLEKDPVIIELIQNL